MSIVKRIITDVTFDNVGTTNFTEKAPTYPQMKDKSNLVGWRFLSVNPDLTPTDISNSATITSDNSLRLKIVNGYISSSSTTPINLPITLNYLGSTNKESLSDINQIAWWYQLGFNELGFNIKFSFKTPTQDCIIFDFGLMSHSSTNDYTNPDYGVPFSDICLYYQNNKFYLSITEKSYNSEYIGTRSVIGIISDSNETLGTIHSFELDVDPNDETSSNTSKAPLYAYFDDVKVLEMLVGSAAGPGSPTPYSYDLNGDYITFYNYSGSVYPNPSSHAWFRPIYSWGTDIQSICTGNNLAASNFSNISLTTNIIDYTTDTKYKFDLIKFIKNPLPAQSNYNINIPINSGDYIDLKSITISGYYFTSIIYNYKDFPGKVAIRKWMPLDLFRINVRVPINIKPEPYTPVDGDFIVEIPFPYPQFTDMQFFLTQVKYLPSVPRKMMLRSSIATVDNLFIPQRYYSRYDERHLVFSNDLGLQEGDEIRFTFCHNDGKFHIQKLEFYFKAQDNASYYLLDMLSPYKKTIENTDVKFRVFVNRKEIVLNKDYTINNETGVLEIINDKLTTSTNNRIDLLCFFTGIDDTAVADLPMSGYIYLKRNMIDRNYNNNLMATFINGKLVPRDKILHISNNIYKIKEDIKSRHDLQILNMSNRINSMVPFYKQSTSFPFTSTLLQNGEIVDNFHPRYIEKNLNISITIPALTTYGRQHFYMYHNPIFFDPDYLLEKKDYYISFIHSASHNLSYELNFYNNDTDPNKSSVNVTLELHIKTPFEDTLEESRSTILLTKLPATVTNIGNEYSYACLQIKQLIKLDIWNNRFLEMCDGVTIRIEPERTYQDQPSEVYFDMTASNFEDYEKEQITVFEVRISDKYDGLGQVLYSKFITFNPEESNKAAIRAADAVKS